MTVLARPYAEATRAPWLLVYLGIAISILDGAYKSALSAWPLLFWTHDATVHVILPAACLYWLRYSLSIRPRDYGLRSLGIADLVVLSFLCSLVLTAGYFAAYRIAQAVFPGHGVFAGFAAMLPQDGSRLLCAVYLSASAAFFEEVTYVGLLAYLFRRTMPGESYAVPLIWTASALFAAGHWEDGLAAVLATGALNAIGCALYLRLNNLWPLIAAHFVTDFVIFV